MDYGRAALIIGLTLLVVGLFNLGIYLAFRRDQKAGGVIKMLHQAGQRAKAPWKDEDDALNELRQLVRNLEKAAPNELGKAAEELLNDIEIPSVPAGVRSLVNESSSEETHNEG